MHLSKDINIHKHSRICSKHFIGGKRNGKNDVPQLFPWTKTRKTMVRQPLSMTARKTSYVSIETRRGIIRHDHGYSKPWTPDSPGVAPETLYGSTLLSVLSAHQQSVFLSSHSSANTDQGTLAASLHTPQQFTSIGCQTESPQQSTCSTGSQTDTSRFCIEQIKDDKGLVHFYTGFEDYEILMICFNFLGPSVQHLQYWNSNKTSKDTQETRGAPRTLSSLNEFFLVLCRLRLGLLEQDLAFRFQISQSTVSRILITWINTLFCKFQEVQIWPSRAQVDATMPASFKSAYPTTRAIVDTTEIFIEQPSSPEAQQLTFSSYKSHNTLKGLIGITPSGAISFVSKLYGGNISDRELTIRSGLLDKLECGDSVMADKGFTIADLLIVRGVSLNIPPMKTEDQLTETELVVTRRIASLRIHVERAIKRIKAFKILQSVPNNMAGITDQVFFVCSFLSNFQTPLVST